MYFLYFPSGLIVPINEIDSQAWRLVFLFNRNTAWHKRLPSPWATCISCVSQETGESVRWCRKKGHFAQVHLGSTWWSDVKTVMELSGNNLGTHKIMYFHRIVMDCPWNKPTSYWASWCWKPPYHTIWCEYVLTKQLNSGSIGAILLICWGWWWWTNILIPIGSMVLVYMLTWRGYIDGIHVTIYSIHGSYGIYLTNFDWGLWWVKSTNKQVQGPLLHVFFLRQVLGGRRPDLGSRRSLSMST